MSRADIEIDIRVADILKCGADIIVMSANPSLLAGSGLSGAIHKVAGPELEAHSRHLGPIFPGNAVLTPAFDLDAHYIIHAVCPRFLEGSDKERQLLAQTYRSALEMADQCSDAKSIAFASMGTGIYRWPLEIAAKIAMLELITSPFEETLMCVTDEQSRLIYQRSLGDIQI